MAADQHEIRMGFRNARGDGAHADFGNQFDGNIRLRVAVFEVEDQLRQVFDRIDVVVGRR